MQHILTTSAIKEWLMQATWIFDENDDPEYKKIL